MEVELVLEKEKAEVNWKGCKYFPQVYPESNILIHICTYITIHIHSHVGLRLMMFVDGSLSVM